MVDGVSLDILSRNVFT